jgi:hypothetical protein
MEREVTDHMSIACRQNGAAFALLASLRSKIGVNSGLSHATNKFDANKHQRDVDVLNEWVFYNVLQFDNFLFHF